MKPVKKKKKVLPTNTNQHVKHEKVIKEKVS